jgi:hypothetical protein
MAQARMSGVVQRAKENPALARVRMSSGASIPKGELDKIKCRKYATQTLTREIFDRGYTEPGVAGELALKCISYIEAALPSPYTSTDVDAWINDNLDTTLEVLRLNRIQ